MHEPFSSWQVVLQSFNFNFYSVFLPVSLFQTDFFFLSEAQHWLHVFWSHFGNQLFIVFWFITVLPLFCLSLGVHHVVWLPRPLKWLLVTFTEFTGSRLSRNPSSGKVWVGFLLHPILPAVCNTILLFGDFGIGSTNNPLIDIFLILITCWCEVVLIL